MPILPMASAGAPEARLGDPLDRLIGDWADAAHAQSGLAVAVHFPLPYAEIAADIVVGQDRRGRDAGPDARTSTARRSASGIAS